MLAPVTHILPLTKVIRARMLPSAGRVSVRAGQKVSAADVIAEAHVPSKHLLIDIRRALNIPQISLAERAVVRQEGDKLTKGDVIAETGGLFSRIVRAPSDCEVISVTGGQVLLRAQSIVVELKAGLSGTVTELIPERGAMIEADGALVQGAWGNGGIDSGLLLVLAHSPEEEFTRSRLDVSMRGAVVMAGHCASAEALTAGGELPLRGLILASMTADLISVANKQKYPILVLEGFGKTPMSESAYRLLTSSEKRDASVNATFASQTGERPEVVIPLPSIGEISSDSAYFAADQRVRVHGIPYEGQIGKLVQVLPGLSVLPSGIRAPAADVQFDSETRAVVPLANLEVLK